MANNIEITGIDDIRRALNSLPESVRPYVLRQIAQKPAQRAVVEARRLQPIGETGATTRRIGILRIKYSNQTVVEVAYKGGLGNIYTSAETISRSGRGSVKGFPTLFKKAGENIRSVAESEMKVDVTAVMVRSMKRYLKNKI